MISKKLSEYNTKKVRIKILMNQLEVFKKTELENEEVQKQISEMELQIAKLECDICEIEMAIESLVEEDKFLIEHRFKKDTCWDLVEVYFNDTFKYKPPVTASALQKRLTKVIKKLKDILEPVAVVST